MHVLNFTKLCTKELYISLYVKFTSIIRVKKSAGVYSVSKVNGQKILIIKISKNTLINKNVRT